MNSIRPPNMVDYGLVICVALIWALAFIAIKIAVVELAPLWVAASRVIIGVLVVGSILLIRGQSAMPQWNLLGFLAIISALNIAIPFALISWAQQKADAGIASLLMATGPISALVLSHFFSTDDKINVQKIVAIIFAFSGVYLIFAPNATHHADANLWLQYLALICASICYASASILMRKIKMSMLRFTYNALLIGALFLSTSAFLVEGIPDPQLSQSTLLAILFLGIVPTGIGYLIRFYLVNTIGVSIFALGMNLVPIFGISLGIIILDEPFRIDVMIALSLILVALLIARKPGKATAKS